MIIFLGINILTQASDIQIVKAFEVCQQNHFRSWRTQHLPWLKTIKHQKSDRKLEMCDSHRKLKNFAGKQKDKRRRKNFKSCFTWKQKKRKALGPCQRATKCV